MIAETLSASDVAASHGTAEPVEGISLSGPAHTSYLLTSYPNRITADTTKGVSREYASPASPGMGRRSTLEPASEIDSEGIEKAMELLRSLEEADAYDMQLLLTGLSGCIMELWTSAARSSETHQQILAALERAVRAAALDGYVTDEQIGALREAIGYLPQQHLGRTASEVVRRRLRESGSGAMSFNE